MKMKNRKVLATLITLFIVACSTGINLYSDNDETQLGKQFDEEIRKNSKEYPVYKGDPKVKEYIDKEIFREILNSPEVKKTAAYHYQMEIIQNDSVLNAFAVPGGYVYIYTGILKYSYSEASLDGVIGHEIAHVERRHATQRITSAYGLQLVLNIALGSSPSKTAEMVANMFGGLALLANSRSDESESDEFSIKYLKSTRFYPGSVKFFFEKLRDDGKVSKGGAGIATFLSTHPDPIKRISETEKMLASSGIEIKHYTDNGNGIFKDSYKKNIVNKLK